MRGTGAARRLRALLPLLAALCACASQRAALRPSEDVEQWALPQAPPLPAPPDFVRASPDEWVRLTSGEWLRGEVDALASSRLDFDSEELDQLHLDWDDVAELHTTRPFTVLLESRAEVTGAVDVVGDLVRVTRAPEQGGAALTFRREDVQRLVKGALTERARWSGELRLGATVRRGNTRQTDTSFGLDAKRRAAATRLAFALDAVQSEQDGAEVANSQRFDGDYHYFVTSRLFLVPLRVEALRDRFQNLDLRATPSVGLGYTFADRAALEWLATHGAGYRWTRYDSVEPGRDREEGEGVGIVGTELSSDLTETLELTAEYSLQASFEDFGTSQHYAKLGLSYDVWEDLDFLVGFVWTRIGRPEPDASGETPSSDDFRLDLGLGWSF